MTKMKKTKKEKSTRIRYSFRRSVAPYLRLLCTNANALVRLFSGFLPQRLFIIAQELLRGEADETGRRELSCTGGREGRKEGREGET